MTFDPVSMTMSSVECTTSYRPKAIVVDRLKQRFHAIERHSQKCKERHNNAQSILRAKERSETALLLQRVQEQKNKKVGKFKPDNSRLKPNLDTSENNDAAYQALTMSRLKRKIQMPDPNEKQTGYGDNKMTTQQEPKKVKRDDNINSNQRQPDYQMPSVSVQIVQNFGNESAKRIETTVNVQSTMQDSQSVSVNVGSKNIKQEMVNEVQHMNQANMNPRVPPSDVNCNDSNDIGGLLGDLESEFDMGLLDEWTNAMTEDDVDELHRVFLTSDSQMTNQPQQQMTSQAQQMTSASHHLSSGQHMTSQQNILHQQPSNPQMQRQQHPNNAQLLCKSEKVDLFHGFHGNNNDSKKENPPLQRMQRGMMQQNLSANIMTQQSLRANMGVGNFGANISAQQNISLNMSSSQPHNFSLRNQQNIAANVSSNNMTTNNNNNLTSQHIQRLNQLSVNSQFSHEAPPEPPRLFHPPASTQMSQSQAGYYESHSQQLKQLAEKRWEMNGSASINMTSDMRGAQHYTQYRSNEIPPMSQPLNMPNHPMSSVPGTQRLSHLDPNMYSRPSQQFMQNQQRSGAMNVMMQQSMSSQMQQGIMMKQRNLQYQQIQQSNQTNYYNRIQESQHQQMANNTAMSFQGNNGLPSWNSHGPSWSANSQVPPPPMSRMQQPPTSELSHGNFDINVDLNILDEILKVQS